MKKVFSLCNDGNHIDCYETKEEAVRRVEDDFFGRKYMEIEECDYEPHCDCENTHISEDDEPEESKRPLSWNGDE